MRVLAWTALLAAGLLAFLVERGLVGRVTAPDLDAVPARLGPLASLGDIAFPAEVLGEVPPDRSLFRRLRDAAGHEGVGFVAWYARSQRWSGRPHPVEVCYAADGWRTLEAHVATTPAGARVGSRRLVRGERTIRVVHWIQTPGQLPTDSFLRDALGRLRHGGGLRQDVASAYFEFEDGAAPPEPELLEAADALIASIETLWRP